MNVARWELAYYMMIEKEKKDLVRWSTFFGTNTTALKGEDPESDADGPIAVIPLSTLINPELMQKIQEQTRLDAEMSEAIGTADAEYEAMVKEMEATGKLTVIEDMFPEINARRHKEQLRRARVELIPDEAPK